MYIFLINKNIIKNVFNIILMSENKHICNICNKEYKSSQSLCNHKRIYHKKDDKFSCKDCKKVFTTNHNLKYHINNSCQFIKMKKEITELKSQIKNNNSNQIINNNNTVNNINNGTINNIIVKINELGTENILDLDKSDVEKIFNKRLTSIVSLVESINFNKKLPSNHSFCAKSLEGKYLIQYNTKTEKLESVGKKYFYYELLVKAIEKMELLYKKYKNIFPLDKQKNIEETIEILNDIKNRDRSDKILNELRNNLIQLSYNNRHIVLNTWDNSELRPNIKKSDDELLEELKNESDYTKFFIINEDTDSDDE